LRPCRYGEFSVSSRGEWVTEEERQRADAQINRQRILDAARDAFAATPEASMNSIAKSAGVGAGTLYRHFPTREALILGVYRQEIQQLVDLAPALLTRHEPLVAMRAWLERLAHYGRMKFGINDALHAAMTPSVQGETYGPMVDAIARLLKAAESKNDIPAGTDAEDLLLLLGFLWRIPPGPGAKSQADRLIALVIAGLKAGK
jgi:AcrR family transcriptional regulator